MTSLPRILITGSSGFLGSYLVQTLRAKGFPLVCVDRELPKSSSYFGQPSSLEYFQYDLRSQNLSALGNCDQVIHLASGAGGVIRNFEDSEIIADELQMLQNLESHFSNSRLIYFSSVNVFESTGVQKEASLKKIKPVTAYAKAKASAEAFVEEYFKDFTIVRPTNFFGPHQPRRFEGAGRSHVIPELIHKISDPKQEFLEVMGDGSQLRNFLHIDDISEFVLRLVFDHRFRYAHLRSDLFLNIAELAGLLLMKLNSQKQIQFQPDYLKFEALKISEFPITNAKTLGWMPQCNDLLEGLSFDRHRKTTEAKTMESANQKLQGEPASVKSVEA